MDAIDMARDCIDQELAFARRRSLARRVTGAQRRDGLHLIADDAVGRKRKRSRAIDEVSRHTESEQSVRAIEPLAIVVDRAIGLDRKQDAVEADAEKVRLFLAAEMFANARVAAVAGDQQIDVRDGFRKAGAGVGVANEQAPFGASAGPQFRTVED